MDRRTKLLALVAVTGWGAFFASLAWQPDQHVTPPSVADSTSEVAEAAAAPATRRRTASAESSDERSAVDSPSAAERPADTLESILAEIERIRESGSGNYHKSLQRLAQLGTPDADAALLELFADESFFRAHQRSFAFAAALKDIDDPRIGPLASAYLDECVENGLYSEAGGYVELIATKYGEVGKQRVMELLKRGSGLQGQAFDQIGRLKDPSLAPQLFQLVRDQESFAKEVFTGMVAWGDEEVRAEVREFARESDVRVEQRRQAMRAYGKSLTANELSTVVSDYWSAQQAGDRRVMLSCLRGATKSDRLDAAELRAQSFTAVQDALAATDRALQQEALYLIEYDDTFQTPEYLALVERLANDASLSEDRRKQARSILVKAHR
ncbi:MAG: hypothetical protein KDC14_04465 [Planctomycetes bacterium]|nr:hypothetical protein [Planctomycetota bacterium]